MTNSKIPITVIVQTKNEENNIESCLRSLADFNEVIVLDSNSSDATCKIAEDVGVSIVNFTWNGRYPKKKQWPLDNLRLKNEWVLQLDADELVTDNLLSEIKTLIPKMLKHEFSAGEINLDYVFSGKTLKYGHRVVKRALLRVGSAHFPIVDDLDIPGMGELEGHYQPIIDGKTIRLSAHLIHNDRDPVSAWFDRHNRYSDWEAHLRTRPQARTHTASARSRQGQLFDRVPFKPFIFFLYSYFFKQGMRDGRAGFDYAFALSHYYWQIDLKTRELRRINKKIDDKVTHLEGH
ncbi:glycosyltransferase family 2 protein [Arthrobacter sp. E3]|uniref:glycosyltransferase family 2 protein n=1 Tax=Arthrobacter sp. E3 TaxID=517402 RepID=UPI001A94F611|nr:glycosyltransferase family 2 protein [Arthrobacter sp. E3]